MPDQQPILIQKSYDLLRESIREVNRFPRSHKFTLGDRLQNKLTDLLELYIEAFYSPKEAKPELLRKANIQLEILRYYYRLGFDLGLYHSIKYEQYAQRLQEIGRMTGGWLKSLDQ